MPPANSECPTIGHLPMKSVIELVLRTSGGCMNESFADHRLGSYRTNSTPGP